MKKKTIMLLSLLLGALLIAATFGYFISLNHTEHCLQNSAESWPPSNRSVQMSETKPLPELAQVIADVYNIPQEDWKNTHYYYQYVDLNEDGHQEILAVVMGMYTSGSGGDSALLVLPYAGMTVSQTFTLVRTPILISDEMTGGAHDLIFMRSGGGGNTELVRLTCVDGIYSMVSNGEVLPAGSKLQGELILGNDFHTDMQTGNMLTLADS